MQGSADFLERTRKQTFKALRAMHFLPQVLSSVTVGDTESVPDGQCQTNFCVDLGIQISIIFTIVK